MTRSDQAGAARLTIDAARLQAELDRLATFSRADPTPNGTAVTRIVFSEDDLAARAWLKSLAAEAGLSSREDAVGNTFFRLEGSDPTLPAVATGSHIDAIPHAGMYDGTVGVLGGLAAVRAIQSAKIRPRRAIEVILFTSEEPTRFGIGCLGSRLLSGSLEPEKADALLDRQDGRTLRAIRETAGFAGPLEGVLLRTGHYSGFVELHIEQGPRLERAGQQIGLVTGIAAPAAYRFVMEGLGGHAGALLMPDRRDALCAAAELVLAVESHARASGSPDTVATVGTCEVYPGAINSVPSRVTLQLDLRDTEAGRRDRVMHSIRREMGRIEREREVAIAEERINEDAPAACDAQLVEGLEQICKREGIACERLVSRAYHDALFMARIAPIAMIFIPCRGGVSHRPDEFAATADIARGALVLANWLVEAADAEGPTV